jgi:hypothetical protein
LVVVVASASASASAVVEDDGVGLLCYPVQDTATSFDVIVLEHGTKDIKYGVNDFFFTDL